MSFCDCAGAVTRVFMGTTYISLLTRHNSQRYPHGRRRIRTFIIYTFHGISRMQWSFLCCQLFIPVPSSNLIFLFLVKSYTPPDCWMLSQMPLPAALILFHAYPQGHSEHGLAIRSHVSATYNHLFDLDSKPSRFLFHVYRRYRVHLHLYLFTLLFHPPGSHRPFSSFPSFSSSLLYYENPVDSTACLRCS